MEPKETEEMTTWAAKVPQELKNKISSLIKDENISSKEFLSNVIELYELNNVKINSGMEKDITDLENSLNRIMSLFKNVVQRNNSLEKSIEEKYVSCIENKDKEITELKDKNKTAKEKFEESLQKSKEKEEKLEKELDEINKKSALLLKEKDKDAELLTSYKEKCMELNSKLSEFNEFKSNYQSVINQNLALQKEVDDKKAEISAAKVNLEIISQRNELNNQNEVLLLKQKHQEEINGINEKHNSETKDILNDLVSSKEKIMNMTLEMNKLQNELTKTNESSSL